MSSTDGSERRRLGNGAFVVLVIIVEGLWIAAVVAGVAWLLTH